MLPPGEFKRGRRCLSCRCFGLVAVVLRMQRRDAW